MKLKYINFIRGVSINRIGKIGVVLITSSFLTFVFLELLRISGVFTNAYFGLITYLLLPTLFVIGLILIPFAWIKHKRQTGKSTKELLEKQFDKDDLTESKLGAKIVRTVLIFTFINILFLLAASFRTLSFMDEPEFCGTACHSVMSPEWTTYQQSPHSRVACVECHVGEGTGALISSKLNGAWQMISATFDLYEKPIPTPVHQLRPARETCEKCHWPEKFYGSKLKTFIRYSNDELSTPKYTTLVLKIDTGEEVGHAGIHWHIGKNNVVRYTSVEDKREEIIWVESKQPDGSFKRYVNKKLSGIDYPSSVIREMDCVDCHNRATHIYEDPSKAVDDRIRKGLIDKTLPYIKRESYGALTASFAESDRAATIIENRIKRFYKKNYPDLMASKSMEIDRSIETLQKIYSRNIHKGMNIDWNVYPDHIGHEGEGGCFRCHNENMVDEKGNKIKYDCTLCHSILAYESEEPFKYLKPIDEVEKDSAMHIYLKEEFLKSFD